MYCVPLSLVALAPATTLIPNGSLTPAFSHSLTRTAEVEGGSAGRGGGSRVNRNRNRLVPKLRAP